MLSDSDLADLWSITDPMDLDHELSCAGPFRGWCNVCKDKKYFCKNEDFSSSLLPRYMTDNLMTLITPEAFTVFVCISSMMCCDGDTTPYDGVAFLTDKNILERTRLTKDKLDKCLQELKEHNLITDEQCTVEDEQSKYSVEYHKFTLLWVADANRRVRPHN